MDADRQGDAEDRPEQQPGERAGLLWDRLAAVWSYEIATADDRPITVGKVVGALLLIVFGTKLVLGSAYVKTAILGISKAWLYLSAPVGGLLLLLRALERLAGI